MNLKGFTEICVPVIGEVCSDSDKIIERKIMFDSVFVILVDNYV